MTEPLLDVRGLSVEYALSGGSLRAVSEVDLQVASGETLGLVGESGCGKSTVALALMRLLPSSADVRGEVLLGATNLLTLPEERMRELRSRSIAMVFQAAMNALNPVFRVGDQVAEPLRRGGLMGRESARKRVREMFELVGLPAARIDAYPHELSGGMKQRVVIAMALIERPKLIIADEPTTALDVVVQDQILGMIKELQQELSFGMLLISHDMAMIAEACDRVSVMYAGRIMEEAPVDRVIRSSAHPYTIALMRSHPDLHGPIRAMRALPGSPPNMRRRLEGCRFAPRCELRTELCRAEPDLLAVDPVHRSRCHYALEIVAGERSLAVEQTAPAVADRDAAEGGPVDPLLRIRGLVKHFSARGSGIGRLLARGSNPIRAVDGVDLDVAPGEIVGLVGESGCGKSTLGRLLTSLETPTAGEITIDGENVAVLSRRDLTAKVQIIFQDPYRSLDPRRSVRQVIEEPLRAHGFGSRAAREKVIAALESVELVPAEGFLNRYPHELSGGQRQRVAIARSMVIDPSLIVADEPVSMLDVSVRSGVMNVMMRMRERLGVAFIFITHDLGVARRMSDRIAVIYLGRIVEIGPTESVLREPAHPYTKMLLASVPSTEPGRERIRTTAQASNAATIATGCRFRARCPFAFDRCATDDPALYPTSAGHAAACHLVDEERSTDLDTPSASATG